MNTAEIEDEFNMMAEETGSPVTAFVQMLDWIVSHNFCVLVDALRKV